MAFLPSKQNIVSLFVHRSSQLYTISGGKSDDCMIGNICWRPLIVSNWGWHYIWGQWGDVSGFDCIYVICLNTYYIQYVLFQDHSTLVTHVCEAISVVLLWSTQLGDHHVWSASCVVTKLCTVSWTSSFGSYIATSGRNASCYEGVFGEWFG
jgi:hypothetical protein